MSVRNRESYVKVLGNLVSVVAALLALGAMLVSKRPAQPPNVTPVVSAPAPVVPDPPQRVPKPKPAPVAVVPTPAPPAPAPAIDREAVAKAELGLDAAARDRARAEARAEVAARRLADAATEATRSARAAKTLAFRVRDPSARIAQAAAQGGFLRSDQETIKGEIATLAQAPRPKAKILSNKNPVAKPASPDEHHFEIRRDRVSYIDLDRLFTLVKSDVQLRMRLSDGARSFDSQVGPVGAFSLQYSFARALPNGLEDLIERGRIAYELRFWEVVPAFEGRGETYEATKKPISDYARTISRLSPTHSTITMWVYPDGFSLYRKLRDDLHSRGFLVAARPLPEAMAIRGSPSGSLSAGQ
jgi:hypothetical protein